MMGQTKINRSNNKETGEENTFAIDVEKDRPAAFIPVRVVHVVFLHEAARPTRRCSGEMIERLVEVERRAAESAAGA